MTATRFNPHPARRPDATTLVDVTGNRQCDVSILIRPEGRMQRGLPFARALLRHVSILIRPEGRMQPVWSWPPPCVTVFQSSSGQKAGCNRGRATSNTKCPSTFQSSSGQKAGCNLLARTDNGSFNPLKAGCNEHRQVSILIRPEGRMQRLCLNFLSVLREPPDTGFPIGIHWPDHLFPPATIQLRTRTCRLQWRQHWVRVRPPAVP